MNKVDKKQTDGDLKSSSNAVKQNGKQRIKFFKLIKKHLTLFSILTGVFIVIVVFFWKDFENKRDRALIIQNVTQQLETIQSEMLMLIAKPLVWSIRAELLRGNNEQVDLLIKDLVKEKNFQFIHIIAPDGNVILSTNKSFEGKSIGNKIDAALLVVKLPLVVQNQHALLVSAPIFGIDRQIATLVIGYKPIEVFQYKEAVIN